MTGNWTRKAWTGARRRLAPPAPTTAVAVIGDVHGRADLLTQLVQRLPGNIPWIFVGDLVDRGEESAAVLRIVHQLCHVDARIQCLMGNHERMMLDFLSDPPGAGPRWLRSGGLQTLASFGIARLTLSPAPQELDRLAAELRSNVGPRLLSWLAGLPTRWQSGSLAVVHAAADPAKPLDAQTEDTLLWGHSAFLSTPRRDGVWVAHGHTIVDAPVFEGSRISVDTGAYYTGRLTAAVVNPDGSVRFITT